MKTSDTEQQSASGDGFAEYEASTKQSNQVENSVQACECNQQQEVTNNGVRDSRDLSDARGTERDIPTENGQSQATDCESANTSGTHSSHVPIDGGEDVTGRELAEEVDCGSHHEERRDVTGHDTDSSESSEGSESVKTDGEAEGIGENGASSLLHDPPRNDMLAGPDRSRRHHARQERERSQMRIAIGGPVLERWRQIGAQWGLDNDGDIARVLLQHYEDIQAGRPPRPPPAPRCLGCGERLVPLPCEACGPNRHSSRFSRDREGGGGGGGGFGGGAGSGDRYCGRCRD